MNKNFLKKVIFMPLVGRIGTMLAAYLVSLGYAQDLTNQIALGLSALALVLFDLAFDYFLRKE